MKPTKSDFYECRCENPFFGNEFIYTSVNVLLV